MQPQRAKDPPEEDGKTDPHEALSVGDPANQPIIDSEKNSPKNADQKPKDRTPGGPDETKLDRPGVKVTTEVMPKRPIQKKPSASQFSSVFEQGFDEVMGNFSIVLNFNS